LSSDAVALLGEGRHAVVCIADVPPSSPSKARYLVKRLRAAVPDAKIIVGRWAPPSLADELPDPILATGAARVSTSWLETREQLYQLVPMLSRAPAAFEGTSGIKCRPTVATSKPAPSSRLPPMFLSLSDPLRREQPKTPPTVSETGQPWLEATSPCE
jgi:hypothetical protein